MRPKSNTRCIDADLVDSLLNMGFAVTCRVAGNATIMTKGPVQLRVQVGGMYRYTIGTQLCDSEAKGVSDIEDIEETLVSFQKINDEVNAHVRELASQLEKFLTERSVAHLLNSKSAGVYEFYSRGPSSVKLFSLRGRRDRWGDNKIELVGFKSTEPVETLDDVLQIFYVWNKFKSGPEENYFMRVITLGNIEDYLHDMISCGLVSVVMQEYKLELSCTNEMAKNLVQFVEVRAIAEPRRVYEIVYQ